MSRLSKPISRGSRIWRGPAATSPGSPASPAFSSAASILPLTSDSTNSVTNGRPALLRGKVGIANAQVAYARYKALFAAPRWQLLAASGAKTQRLLWASTGVKDPAYKDTMYVEALIGRDTVDTIPPATMDAFRDRGQIAPDAIERDVVGARTVLAELENYGVSLKEVTEEELIKEGVRQFADAFDKLFGTIARRRRTLLEGDRARLEISPGSSEIAAAFKEEMEVWRKEGRIRRLWAGDKSLWSGTDENKWLGWLNVADQRACRYWPAAELRGRCEEARFH